LSRSTRPCGQCSEPAKVRLEDGNSGTYRFRAHSMYDPERYRNKTEVEEWKKRCPILTFSQKCIGDGLISEVDMREIEREAALEINEAAAYAEACTCEPVEDLTRFVYSERRTQ